MYLSFLLLPTGLQAEISMRVGFACPGTILEGETAA